MPHYPLLVSAQAETYILTTLTHPGRLGLLSPAPPLQNWSVWFSTGMLTTNHLAGKILPVTAISDHLSSFQLTTNYLYWSHSFTFTPLPHYKLSIELESTELLQRLWILETQLNQRMLVSTLVYCWLFAEVWELIEVWDRDTEGHVSWCKINICPVSLCHCVMPGAGHLLEMEFETELMKNKKELSVPN